MAAIRPWFSPDRALARAVIALASACAVVSAADLDLELALLEGGVPLGEGRLLGDHLLGGPGLGERTGEVGPTFGYRRTRDGTGALVRRSS
ncbi:MAG TPA: hypothetical protein VIJ51_11615 [Solirubrobacteraceae bacterium]